MFYVNILSAQTGVFALDLPLELEKPVNKGFGRWRAARHIDVHGHHTVAPAHHGIGIMIIPPPLAQEPIEITQRGSGIWS